MEMMFRKVRLSVSVSAALTLLAGLLLTALLFASLRRNETQVQADRFHQRATLRINLVADGMGDAVEQLMLVNQLFRTMGVVSREQFAAFTGPLLARYPAIQALSFQRFLLDRDRAGYETAMKRRDPNYRITEFVDGKQRPAGQRANYNVVEYIEPLPGNEAAFGLDTGRTDDQAAARQRSRSTGQVAATGLLSLVQQQGFHTGFLVLAPLYAPGAPLDTPALRERAVIGETAAVFRVDRLLQSLLGGRNLLGSRGISVRIYAASSADPSQLAFSDGAAPPKTPLLPIPSWLMFDQVAPEHATFIVAGNPWHMTVAQAPAPFSAEHAGSLYALLGGILSSLLAAFYVYSLVSRKSTIERVTSERTSLLRDDNRRLSLDLAQRMDAEKSLRLREKVIDVSSNAILICSAQGPDYAIEYVNPAFEAITGYAAGEVLGKSLRTFQDDSQDHRNIEEIRAALNEQREGHAVLRNYRKDGTGYWNDLYISPLRDDAGEIVNFMVAQYDISAVMRFEAELEYQAHHDALTGLANRNLLHARVERAITDARLSGAELWVVFIDLDRFKVVNDTLGHDAGDVLLKALAERIKLAVRDIDTLARMGGDEFMLVLPEGTGRDASLAVIRNVMAAIAAPLMIQSHEFHLTCSMGVAAYPNDGDDAETLAKHADIAMYKAKELGRNSYQFYTAAMSARTLERLEMEADLHHALARDEFVLHYQPQIDLRSGTIVGMEVLLRWNRPGHGLVGAGAFHRAGRGYGADHPDRRLGAARGLRADRELAPRRAGRTADRGEPVAAPVHAERDGAIDRRDPRRDRARRALPRTGADRKPGDGRRRKRHRHPARAEATRRAGGHRRLRHRAFEPVVPAPLPDRHPEDRPGVRARHRAGRRRRGDRARDHFAGAQPAPESDRRGRRDERAAGLPAQPRLRRGARLPVQPPGGRG